MVIFEAFVGCHDVLILVKSLMKWRQRPDMTLAVDWDVKHQFKQNKASPFLFKHQLSIITCKTYGVWMHFFHEDKAKNTDICQIVFLTLKCGEVED